jgi:hypothetical protein
MFRDVQHQDKIRRDQRASRVKLRHGHRDGEISQADNILKHILEMFQQARMSQALPSTEAHLGLFIPLMEFIERYLLHEMTEMRLGHRKWLQKVQSLITSDMAKFDDLLSAKWREFRGTLEDFQEISGNFREYVGLWLLDGSEDNKFTISIVQRHDKLLKRGRALEQHVRDTIQVNIGNLSLRQSRKSIQQADSVGRLSFLGFVFIPLSLVMSFYGMNISEITGSGASWRVFLISAAALSALVLIVCCIMWWKSRRVKFLVILVMMPVVIVIWSLTALIFLLLQVTHATILIRIHTPFFWWAARYKVRAFLFNLQHWYPVWWTYRKAFLEE